VRRATSTAATPPAGQSAGLIEDIVSAREVIKRLVAEAHEVLAQISLHA